MKKIARTAILLCCIGIIGTLAVFLPRHFTKNETETVYIALAGPMSGFAQEEGKAMLRGATLAYEQVKKKGDILKNKKIEIIPYDDQDSQTAVHIASDIVNNNKALLVLGHYSSSSSAAAGPMYQSNGIPAITGSATVDNVIIGNKWFFRTIPGDHAMTEFIAYNMHQLAGSTTKKVSIIYDTNFYETTAEKFKKIAGNISDDLRIWSFAGNSNKKDSAFKKIIAEIRAEQSVGPIFFATGSLDCGRLISMFKYPGTDYLVIGTSSLAVPTFIQQFEKKHLNEQESLRDYTNDTFAVSPFISYLADQPDALVFREKFLHQYGKEPTWVAAAYYDAMLVALNAVEQAEILGGSIREDRRRVRNALNRFNEKDVAVQGITGDLYFDENGNANLPLSLGIWFNHTFLPFYQQYKKQDQQQMLADDTDEDEEQYISSFRAVYAGVDINVIRNIDLEQGSFTADFYLWFRFKGVLDDTAITFINAQHPVSLGKPIIEKRNGDITVRAYRVIADLKIDSTKAFYPLDRHTLRISFRHNKETRDKLIYIPDVIGVNGAVGKINRGENMLDKISGWETSEISSRQDIEIIQDKNKKNISYSRIDTKISIHRQEWGMLWGKILLPFLYIITLGCLILFISPERIYIRLFALFSLLFLAVNIRILYTYIVPGQELTKYIFYLVLVLLLFSVLLSGITYLAHRYKCFRTAKCILYNGIFLYLVVVIGGIIFLLHSHSYTPWSTKTNSVIIQQESLTWRVANKVQG